MKRTRSVLTSMVLAGTLALSACSGGGSSSTTGGASGATGEPVPGGNARIFQISEPRTMDTVQLMNQGNANSVMGNAIFGTLFTGDAITGALQPSMAEELNTTDKGATFELTLRDGLMFTDGTPYNAEAVKLNFDRLRDPKNLGINSGMASEIAETEVIDPVTLKLTLSHPLPNFGQMILGSSLNWTPSPTAMAKGPQAFDAAPIGAGPFVMQSWTRGDVMELTKNPDYWDAPKPYLDSLTLKVSADGQQRFNTLMTGGTDMVIDNSAQTTSKAEQAGFATYCPNLNGGTGLVFNTQKAPFDNPVLREAITKAIDRDALNASAFNGEATVPESMFTEDSPFYTGDKLTTYNRAEAERLLADATGGAPLNFTITAISTSGSRALAEATQAQINTLPGVNAEVKLVDYVQGITALATSDFEATMGGTPFLDPEPGFTAQFLGGSPGNYSQLDDPQMNDAITAGQSTSDPESRKAAFQVVQERFAATNPSIFYVRPENCALAATNVGGMRMYSFGSLIPAELWIQQ